VLCCGLLLHPVCVCSTVRRRSIHPVVGRLSLFPRFSRWSHPLHMFCSNFTLPSLPPLSLFTTACCCVWITVTFLYGLDYTPQFAFCYTPAHAVRILVSHCYLSVTCSPPRVVLHCGVHHAAHTDIASVRFWCLHYLPTSIAITARLPSTRCVCDARQRGRLWTRIHTAPGLLILKNLLPSLSVLGSRRSCLLPRARYNRVTFYHLLRLPLQTYHHTYTLPVGADLPAAYRLCFALPCASTAPPLAPYTTPPTHAARAAYLAVVPTGLFSLPRFRVAHAFWKKSCLISHA